MKLYIKTNTGWTEAACPSSKIRMETEDGVFTIVERMDGDTLRTQLSVDGQLIVLPHAANSVQVRETP